MLQAGRQAGSSSQPQGESGAVQGSLTSSAPPQPGAQPALHTASRSPQLRSPPHTAHSARLSAAAISMPSVTMLPRAR